MTPPDARDSGRLASAQKDLEFISERTLAYAGQLGEYRSRIGQLPERIMQLLGSSSTGVEKIVAGDLDAARKAVAQAEHALQQAHTAARKAAQDAARAAQDSRRGR